MKYTITFETDLPIKPIDLEQAAWYAIALRWRVVNHITGRMSEAEVKRWQAAQAGLNVKCGAVCEICDGDFADPGELAQQYEVSHDQGATWQRVWLCSADRHTNQDLEIREI